MSRAAWIVIAALGIAAGGAAQEAVERGQPAFTRLFNGRSLDGFTPVGVPEDTFRVENGLLVCSGKPPGYLATKKSYKSFVLRFEWRYPRPEDLPEGRDAEFQGASGVLVHITGAAKVWPRSVQVQLFNRDAGNLFPLEGAFVRASKDATAQTTAIKPVGEWNQSEVRVTPTRITSRLNGVVVSEARGSDLKEGPLGFQSRGAEIHFRNIEIAETP